MFGKCNRLLIFTLLFLFGCATSKKPFDPYKKYSPQQLNEDFSLFQNIMEQRHPSLYWYTPKPAIDEAFADARLKLSKGLSEYEFRKVLQLVAAKIQCGHTTVQLSKKYMKYADTVKIKSTFPLFMKVWGDTAVIVHNIYKDDPTLKKGVVIDSLNGYSIARLQDTLYQYISADGSNKIAKDQYVSNSNNFGALYTSVYGWKNTYNIAYRDSAGMVRSVILTPFASKADSTKKKQQKKAEKKKKVKRKERLLLVRDLTIDSTGDFALMQLNSFSERNRLKYFFRQSFKKLKEQHVKNLVIDLRINGGGRLSNSNLLTRYLASKPFKIGDSLYAVSTSSKYSRYISKDVWYRISMFFMTNRKADGKYHFTRYEKHWFQPKKNDHFSGNVYLLSGGSSFSATTLVLSALRNQPNVTIVGEPSGGAAYGNSAWYIPDVTLPNTKIRFRLPLFRLVIDKNIPKDGKGVQPEVFAGPTVTAIKNGIDYKIEKTKELLSAQHID